MTLIGATWGTIPLGRRSLKTRRLRLRPAADSTFSTGGSAASDRSIRFARSIASAAYAILHTGAGPFARVCAGACSRRCGRNSCSSVIRFPTRCCAVDGDCAEAGVLANLSDRRCQRAADAGNRPSHRLAHGRPRLAGHRGPHFTMGHPQEAPRVRLVFVKEFYELIGSFKSIAREAER